MLLYTEFQMQSLIHGNWPQIRLRGCFGASDPRESSPANPNPPPLFLSPPSHSFLPLRISSNSKNTMWSRSLHTSHTYKRTHTCPSGHIEGQCATLPVTSSPWPWQMNKHMPQTHSFNLGYSLCYNTNLLVPSHKVTRGRATKEITPSVDGLMWVKLQTRNPFVKWTFILSSNLHANQFIGLCLNFYLSFVSSSVSNWWFTVVYSLFMPLCPGAQVSQL